MELKVWSKTLLYVYKNLDNIADAIDKVVKATSLKKGGNCDSTYFQAEKIIELMDRKKAIINIKCLIENILIKIDNDLCRILILKFFDKIKADDIAQLMNVSKRTIFRKINSGIQSCESQLIKQGYDFNKLEDMFKTESWVYEIYDKFFVEQKKKNNCTFDFENINLMSADRLVNLALNSINNTSSNKLLKLFN